MSNIIEESKNIIQSAELIYSAEQISSALDQLAEQLNTRFAQANPQANPLVLCVMRGGLIFTGHLLTRLNFMIELDYLHATRYRESTSGARLEWLSKPKVSLENRTVLILDDILDEGITLDAIVDYCSERGASEVVSAVLLHKKHGRCKTDVSSDYVALDVDDKYVFGFGMDYKGQFRHLSSIYAVSEKHGRK